MTEFFTQPAVVMVVTNMKCGSKIASTFFEHFVLSLSMSTDCKNATATLYFEQVIKAKHPLGPNGKIMK